MNIFTGIFQSSAGEWEQARNEFIFKFGEEAYGQHIQPYAERGEAGYIFLAPNRVLSFWFMDRLCEIHAAQLRENFAPPPEFIAVDPDPPPTVSCESCGTEVPEDATVYGGRYNLNYLCLMCLNDLRQQELEAYIQAINERMSQAIEEAKRFWQEVHRISEERVKGSQR